MQSFRVSSSALPCAPRLTAPSFLGASCAPTAGAARRAALPHARSATVRVQAKKRTLTDAGSEIEGSPNPILVVGIAAGGLLLMGFALFALNKPPPEEKAGYMPKAELEKKQAGKALEPAELSGKKPGVQVYSPGNTGNPN